MHRQNIGVVLLKSGLDPSDFDPCRFTHMAKCCQCACLISAKNAVEVEEDRFHPSFLKRYDKGCLLPAQCDWAMPPHLIRVWRHRDKAADKSSEARPDTRTNGCKGGAGTRRNRSAVKVVFGPRLVFHLRDKSFKHDLLVDLVLVAQHDLAAAR